MDTTVDQQVAIDEALVPTAQCLRIRMSNFRLLSDIKSKESTLQLVYDVLHRCPFFNAFLVTADHILDLESFKNILHICPRVQGQPFAEPPFEEEILASIHFLGHSATIRTLTDVNINKLYQPWISFAALINKCLTGKSSVYDSLRLSQAQILWGLYHKRNVDYAYLMWEDFVYQVEHKNQKKNNEMYYPRFTKPIIHHFISKDPSIPRRNKFGALLPIELTNDEIKNSKAYKEYYEIATGKATPKPKASVRRTKSSSDTSITPPTADVSPRLKAFAKGKQTEKASKAKSLSALSEVAMTEAQQLKLVTKLRSLEEHFSEVTQTNQFVGAVSAIPRIIQHYMDQRMNKAVKVAIQIQSSHSSRTSYAVATGLSETELKKILIEKIKGNKSIQRSDKQRNLYKALVDAYESNKIIFDTYGETVTRKRRRDDDEDKDEEPSAGPDLGSKRSREGKEPESVSAPSETATKSAGRSTTGSRSRQASASKSAFAEEHVQTTSQMEEPSHPEFETGAEDQPTIQSSQHPECSNITWKKYTKPQQINWIGSILKGGASSRKYTTSVTKTKVADYEYIKWIEDLVPRTTWIQEPIDYDKHAL
nr:hypothetical protein [Tanacetum cinerariifolium]